MKSLNIFALFVAVSLYGFGTASAATLFSNLGEVEDGFAFLPNTSRLLATDYKTGPFATLITGVVLRMQNRDIIEHSFSTSIWSDNEGLPGTLLWAFDPFLVPARFDLGSGPADFSATPSGTIYLAASTTYWQVLQMNEQGVGGEDAEWKFTFSQSTDLGTGFATIPSTSPKGSVDGGVTWFNFSPGNFQFALMGVPEPSAVLLLVFGVPVLAMRRRRKH